MLRPDARENADTPLSDMLRHVDYMVNRMGIDCVALGSDFDGAKIPGEIGDASGNQNLSLHCGMPDMWGTIWQRSAAKTGCACCARPGTKGEN